MGWKKIKEHYRISHIVQVTSDGICIGSGYIHNLIVVSLDGEIIKGDPSSANSELVRYQVEMRADPDMLRTLALAEDEFAASIPVFTYNGAEILEKQCEELGWPNVTHDGDMMFENTFSADRDTVVEWAKKNCLSSIRYLRDEVVPDRRAKLEEAEGELARRLEAAKVLGIDEATMVESPQT